MSDTSKTDRVSGRPLSGRPLSGRPLSGRPLSGRPLSGRVVVVAGTGTPQGRAAAVALAREGASIVAVDADADAAAATASDVRALGVPDGDEAASGGSSEACRPVAAAFVGDPDDPADAAALVEMVAEIYPD